MVKLRELRTRPVLGWEKWRICEQLNLLSGVIVVRAGINKGVKVAKPNCKKWAKTIEAQERVKRMRSCYTSIPKWEWLYTHIKIKLSKLFSHHVFLSSFHHYPPTSFCRTSCKFQVLNSCGTPLPICLAIIKSKG